MTQAANTLARAQATIAAQGGRHIGDLVTWNFRDVDCERAKVREVFEAEGLGNLIPDPDPATALSRAAGELPDPGGVLTKRFAQPRKDSPVAFGVYVATTNAGEAGDGFACGARVRVQAGGTVTALPPEGGTALPDAMEHAEAIASRANRLIVFAKAKDLGGAQIQAVKQLGGIPLRDKGGAYLLPPSSCDRWRRVSAALEAYGIAAVRIEMHDAPANVKAVASSAKSALEDELRELRADLERAGEDGMRTSTMVRRVQECGALVAKAELYRGVLQGEADKIEARVRELQKRFQAAVDGDEDAFTLPGDVKALLDGDVSEPERPAPEARDPFAL